jgi:cell division protein FtsX
MVTRDRRPPNNRWSVQRYIRAKKFYIGWERLWFGWYVSCIGAVVSLCHG